MQGAAAHVRGAAEDDAAAGGEQHAAAAELQQQQCSAAADFQQQQLQHASGAAELQQLKHAPGAELKHADAAGDQDDQAGSPGIARSSKIILKVSAKSYQVISISVTGDGDRLFPGHV